MSDSNELPYRSPAKRGYQYKVISVRYADNSNWATILEDKLEALSEEGWRPILYTSNAGSDSVIMERPQLGT